MDIKWEFFVREIIDIGRHLLELCPVFEPHCVFLRIVYMQAMFVAMSRSYVDTLPRKRGVVVLTKQTIGRYSGHGVQSSA